MTDTTEPQTARDEADVDTVASRATQVITRMGADIRALTGQRDRYRAAWCSARERAQAYGEGILRVVKDRESYQEWLRQAEERAAVPAEPSAPADRAGLRDRVADVLAEADGWRWAPGFKSDSPTYVGYQKRADAVMSVLPPAADRSAVLREAADAVAADTEIHIRYGSATDYANRHADLLRRLAAGERDEQQAQQECPLCSHLTCVGGKPCGVISTERGDLAEPCGCTGAEAQPPRHRWFVETRDGLADQWAPGTRYVDRRLALGRYAALNENHPTWKDGTPVERRIVRETTTFTVEQPAAAPVAGQPPADTGEEARS